MIPIGRSVALLAATALGGCSVGEQESARDAQARTEARELAPPSRAAPAWKPPLQALLTVTDADTGRPVQGALVAVESSARHTDEKGTAAVPIRHRGEQRLRVSGPGYVPYRERASFYEGREVRIYRRASQWPIFGANPARTQAHPAIRLRPPFRVVWRRKLGSLLEFPAVVWGGVAYVNNMRGVLHAVSMRSGRVLWRRKIGTRVASSPAVVPERGELITTTMLPGDVNVHDLRTGRVKWRYRTGLTEPSPVVRNGIAYLAATNGNVYALDLRRRGPRWIHSVGAKITSSPALVGRRLYVGDYAGRVVALDARSGRRLWTGSAGSRVYGTVAVAGGRVFAPSVFSGLSALSARSGRLLWRIPVGAYLYSSPAAYRGRVYFGTYAGVVYSASARSGRILWSQSAGGSVSGAVQVVAGVVYAGSFGGRVTAWHWRNGRELWRFPAGRYAPVSGNAGRLLIHGGTQIWAVKPRRKR